MLIETFNGAFDNAIIYYGTDNTVWRLGTSLRDGKVDILYWARQIREASLEINKIADVDYDKLLEWADGKSL